MTTANRIDSALGAGGVGAVVASAGTTDGVDGFCAWFVARMRRTRGHEPSPVTLKVKRSRARSLLRWAEVPSVSALAATLADRGETVRLVNFIHERMGPASVAQVVQVLKQLGEYCV